MKLLNRLLQKVRNPVTPQSPYGENYPNLSVSLLLEAWDSLPKIKRESLVAWAKENLYKDYWAWRIMQKVDETKG